MTRSIFTSISPNAELSDVLRACSLIVSPRCWREGESQGIFVQAVQQYFNVRHVFAFESGRTCLSMILKAAGIHEGDEVLLQAYTCVAVPNAIRWAGGVPVYVDCDPSTFSLSLEDCARKLTRKSKALIVQHTFGIPAPMAEIMRYAKDNNLFVIEDCAHSLGAEYQGKKLGMFGDASFFSFGRDKVLSSVFGGIAITRNEEVAARLKALHRLSPLPRLGWIVQQLLHPIICWIVLATFDFLGLGKSILACSKKIGLLSKPVRFEERKGKKPSFTFKRMPNALCSLALLQWGKLARYTAHRQRRFAYYQDALAHVPIGLPSQSSVQGACLRYPILVEKPDELMAYARAQKIYLGDWYRDPIAPSHVAYDAIGYIRGSCPAAERLAVASINLPTDIHITDAIADRIIACLKSYYAQH